MEKYQYGQGMHLILRELQALLDQSSAGIKFLEKYRPGSMHDSIPQFTNYAVFLSDIGEPDCGMTALKRLARYIKTYNSEQTKRWL